MTGVLLGLTKALGSVNAACLTLGRGLGAVCMAAMVAIILAQVFFRYVVGNALAWPEEAARFLMLWAAGLMIATAFRRGGFVSIDMLVRLLPRALASALSLLQDRVANGLRARLASASLLTGGLKVEMILVPDAPPARLVEAGDSYPVMPTTENETSDAAATVEGVFTRINNLPIEELLNSAIGLMNSAQMFIGSDELQQTPKDVRTLINEVTGLVSSDSVKNIPVTLNATLLRVETLVATLEQEQMAKRLLDAVDSVSAAADSFTTSTEGVPALIAEIETVAANAGKLELQQLVDELTALTRSADQVIGTPDAVALPGSLKNALDELNYTLQELREGGAIENVNQTLASARNAADNIAVSAQDLPQIVDRLSSLFTQASRTIEGYNQGDQISRTAQDTMRDIQKAADALASLARTIERNPNSLLLGR